MEQVRPHPGLGPARSCGCTSITPPGGGPARPDARAAVLLPEAIVLPGAQRLECRAPAGCELLGFEGEIALVIGKPARRVAIDDAWSHVEVGHRQQRPRRLRPPLRGQGIQPPVQGRRRLHPRRPGPARRGQHRPGNGSGSAPGTTAAWSGRQHRGPALPVRPAHRGSVPTAHPRNGRHHSHRHSRRRLRGQARRPRRG